jgi:hypothetical protein
MSRRFSPDGADFKAVENLQEVDDMLAENIDAWAEGQRAQGVQQQARSSLRQLLTHRFKTELPNNLDERINTANVEQIQVWFERGIDAPDLDAVFEH